jgi:hypothetical protein
MSKKEILHKVEYLKNLTGLNLLADFSSSYGGYRLVIVDKQSGSRSGAFNRGDMSARLKSKEFDFYLSGLIGGIVYQLERNEFNNGKILNYALH